MQAATSTTPPHVCAFAHRFTGKERDAESGLDYFGARYLSSSMGRFTSPDPMLNSGRVGHIFVGKVLVDSLFHIDSETK